MSQKIAFWKHHPIADQNGRLLAKETVEEQQKFGFDIVKLTPAGSWLATCYGITDTFDNDSLGRRTITKRCILKAEDWIQLPVFSSPPVQLAEQLLAAQLTCNAISDKPIYATVFSPLTQAIQMAGLETFKAHWKLNKKEVLHGLEIITKNTLRVLQLFKEQGISGLYYVSQAMQIPFFNVEEYEAIGKPSDTSCLEAASVLYDDTIFHIHGEPVYFCLKEGINNVRLHYEIAAANSSYNTALELTNYPVLPGIPAQQILSAQSEQDIQALLMTIGGKRTSLPEITCGCVLPLATSDEIIIKWVNAIRNG